MTPPTGLSDAEAVAAQMNDGSLMIFPVQFVRDLISYVRALETPKPRRTVFAEAREMWR
jgi:hypothetical protein